jgi:hypothetical protein
MKACERRPGLQCCGPGRTALLVSALVGGSTLLAPTAACGQSAELTLTVGTAIGPEEASFVRIADVEVARDGRIVVIDEGTSRISVFDANGQFLQRFGGKGEGPSEFLHIGAAALTGDTLIVLDRSGGKLVYFTLDGSFLDTRPSGFSVHEYGFPGRLYPVRGGNLVLEGVSGCSLPRVEGEDTQWRLMMIRPGKEPVTLRRRDAGTMLAVYGTTDRGTFCTTLGLPFGAPPLVAVRADGVLASAVGGSPRVALYGDPTPSSADVPVATWFHDPPATELQLLAPGREFTRRDRNAWQKATLASRSGPNVGRRVIDRLRQAMDEIVYPEHWPAYDRLLFDTPGDLWARRPPAIGAAETTWDVMQIDGTRRGTVRLPAKLDVRVVSGDRVYGIAKGDWDEDLLQRFDVRWN